MDINNDFDSKSSLTLLGIDWCNAVYDSCDTGLSTYNYLNSYVDDSKSEFLDIKIITYMNVTTCGLLNSSQKFIEHYHSW